MSKKVKAIKERPGRPKHAQKHEEPLPQHQIRCTHEEWNAWHYAAKALGMRRSTWIRITLSAVAADILAQKKTPASDRGKVSH